jgi:hypothetical protein
MRKAGADTTAKITDITMKIVKLLTPLDSDGRKKVIKASLTLLGEAALELENGGTGSAAETGTEGARSDAGELGLSAKADAWIRQNGLTKAQLEEVFEIDGENTTLIAHNVPGKSKKEQTIAAYIIQGIVKLLGTGEPTFDDKSARKICEDLGCYNAPNHALYVDSIGNSVTGSKDKGWKLTAPGLKKGAELVKEMTTETAKES